MTITSSQRRDGSLSALHTTLIFSKVFRQWGKKMKKGTVLNSGVSAVISRLGYTDTLVVCDADLPIPNSTTRIDVTLTRGVPSSMQVLGVVTREMQVKAAILASEIKRHNPQFHETLPSRVEQLQ